MDRFSPALKRSFETDGAWVEAWGYRSGVSERWKPQSIAEAEMEIATMRDRIRELSRERSELHRGKWQLRHEIDALNARLQRSEGVEPPSLSSAKRS